MLKRDWPEHIASSLGIPTVFGSDGPWISNGDTTDVSWFRAMYDVLGIDYPRERIRAMEALVTRAGGHWDAETMSSAGVGKQAGGNVRKEGFEALWAALLASDEVPAAGPGRDHNDQWQAGRDAALPELVFVLRAIRLRQGQPDFRKRLLLAYEGACPVTGTNLPDLLEAAHIKPHANGGTTSTTNGLLLRADIHTMFDLGLIAIDTDSWTVLVQDRVSESSTHGDLAGADLRLPRAQHISPRSRRSMSTEGAQGL